MKNETQAIPEAKKQNPFFAWVRKNAVMCIALLAAIVTSLIVPPDGKWIESTPDELLWGSGKLGYFDLKTLTCLFCVLAVVCALKNIRFFYMLARKSTLAIDRRHPNLPL